MSEEREEREEFGKESEIEEHKRELLSTYASVSPEEQELMIKRFPELTELLKAEKEETPEVVTVEIVKVKPHTLTEIEKIFRPSEIKLLKAIRGVSRVDRISKELEFDRDTFEKEIERGEKSSSELEDLREQLATVKTLLEDIAKGKLTDLARPSDKSEYEKVKELFGARIAGLWGMTARATLSREEREKLDEDIARVEKQPRPKTSEKPIKVSSTEDSLGKHILLRKCYERTYFDHKDALGNPVNETEEYCYRIGRDFTFEMNCINKLKEYNKTTRRHFDDVTKTVITEDVVPLRTQLLSVFLCSPAQGFSATMLAELLGLNKDSVLTTLAQMAQEKVGDKPLISSPIESFVLVTEPAEKEGARRYEPPKKIESRELLGERRFVMDLDVKQHLTSALEKELITGLTSWWNRQPIKLS